MTVKFKINALSSLLNTKEIENEGVSVSMRAATKNRRNEDRTSEGACPSAL